MKYCIDIDDTLLFTTFRESGFYEVVTVNQRLIDKTNKLFINGDEIIIHTARHWNLLALTQTQLKDAGVLYTTLVMGKPVADFYIDDKGVKPNVFLG